MKLQARLCLLFVALPCGLSRPMQPNVRSFDKTCNYTATRVPRRLFHDGTDFSLFLFPLEDGQVYTMPGGVWKKPWEACFGPEEPYSIEAIKRRKKLPCSYSVNDDGTIDYWEEHACDVLVKSNCYCYALNRYVGSFCRPGHGNLGDDPPVSCSNQIKGVIADGGIKVDRKTVYSKPPRGHYIALAVMPGLHGDDGDFHYWRRDSDGAWSNKPGTAMSRRTFQNGSKVMDVEAPESLGHYKDFCAYFDVEPAKMKIHGVGAWISNLPDRFHTWSEAGFTTATRPIPRPTPGWMLAYKWYWEIPIYRPATGSSRAAAAPRVPSFRRSDVPPRGA